MNLVTRPLISANCTAAYDLLLLKQLLLNDVLRSEESLQKFALKKDSKPIILCRATVLYLSS